MGFNRWVLEGHTISVYNCYHFFRKAQLLTTLGSRVFVWFLTPVACSALLHDYTHWLNAKLPGNQRFSLMPLFFPPNHIVVCAWAYSTAEEGRSKAHLISSHVQRQSFRPPVAGQLSFLPLQRTQSTAAIAAASAVSEVTRIGVF